MLNLSQFTEYKIFHV